jgi:hypothetical protein
MYVCMYVCKYVCMYCPLRPNRHSLLTSLNCTQPASPSSATDEYAASGWMNSWQRLIVSLRKNVPMSLLVAVFAVPATQRQAGGGCKYWHTRRVVCVPHIEGACTLHNNEMKQPLWCVFVRWLYNQPLWYCGVYLCADCTINRCGTVVLKNASIKTSI